MKRLMHISTSLAWVVALTVFLWSPTLLAQQASSEPTAGETGDYAVASEGQKTLNDQGVKALIAKDYERAVGLLQESLALGDLNITYLNLGRAYQRMGRCFDAQDAYLSAISAPAVEEPSQRIVDAKAEKYLDELREECAEEFAEDTRWGDAPAVKWGLVGGGAAIAAFGAFAILRANQLAPDTDAFQRNGDGVIVEPTQQAAYDERSRSRTWGTIGISAVTVGVVAAGVGTYFVVTGESSEGQPTAAVGPNGSWQVGWSVRF